jgi:mRNA interferase MazF
MTAFVAGELVVVSFPFTAGRQAKNRPALVVLDTGDADLVVARMTTRQPMVAFDISVADWSGAGLRSPAVIRLHKLFTLEKSQVHFRLGQLQPADRLKVAAILRQTFANW